MVHVASGNFISARPIGIIDGTDLQYAGVVRCVVPNQTRHMPPIPPFTPSLCFSEI